jgi:hypothetical protein
MASEKFANITDKELLAELGERLKLYNPDTETHIDGADLDPADKPADIYIDSVNFRAVFNFDDHGADLLTEESP